MHNTATIIPNDTTSNTTFIELKRTVCLHSTKSNHQVSHKKIVGRRTGMGVGGEGHRLSVNETLGMFK